MKKTVALLLALCLLISASCALALEITEEHFPGYCFALHTAYKDVKDTERQAGTHYSPMSSQGMPASADHALLLDRRMFSAERGEIRGVIVCFQGSGTNRDPVVGSRFMLKMRGSEAADTLNENLEWLEEHFGASPVGSGQYLLMLGSDLVTVSVYQAPKNPAFIVFDLFPAEDADQALAAYGYQSPDEVPAAPWAPSGIPQKGE